MHVATYALPAAGAVTAWDLAKAVVTPKFKETLFRCEMAGGGGFQGSQTVRIGVDARRGTGPRPS